MQAISNPTVQTEDVLKGKANIWEHQNKGGHRVGVALSHTRGLSVPSHLSNDVFLAESGQGFMSTFSPLLILA